MPYTEETSRIEKHSRNNCPQHTTRLAWTDSWIELIDCSKRIDLFIVRQISEVPYTKPIRKQLEAIKNNKKK